MSDQPGSGPPGASEGLEQAARIIQKIVVELRGQPLLLFGIAAMVLALVGLFGVAAMPAISQLVWFPYVMLAFGLVLVGMSRVHGARSVAQRRAPLMLRVRVHETGDRTRGIADALVRISADVPFARTNDQGDATFTMHDPELERQSVDVNASRPGYQSRQATGIKLGAREQLFLELTQTPDTAPAAPTHLTRMISLRPSRKGGAEATAADNLRIGRKPDSDLVLEHPTVSWEHGQIMFLRGTYCYRHLSTSGNTTIERRGEIIIVKPGDVAEYPLRNQDRLLVGDDPTAYIVELQIPANEDAGYVQTEDSEVDPEPIA